MKAMEAVKLCRYVKAACPQQAIDEYTPQTWSDLLADIRYDDAALASRNLAQRQPFVAPAEIRAEVRRIRDKRIADHGTPIPPAGLTQDEEREWLRDAVRRIGDGETVPDGDRGVLVSRDLRSLGGAA